MACCKAGFLCRLAGVSEFWTGFRTRPLLRSYSSNSYVGCFIFPASNIRTILFPHSNAGYRRYWHVSVTSVSPFGRQQTFHFLSWRIVLHGKPGNSSNFCITSGGVFYFLCCTPLAFVDIFESTITTVRTTKQKNTAKHNNAVLYYQPSGHACFLYSNAVYCVHAAIGMYFIWVIIQQTYQARYNSGSAPCCVYNCYQLILDFAPGLLYFQQYRCGKRSKIKYL